MLRALSAEIAPQPSGIKVLWVLGMLNARYNKTTYTAIMLGIDSAMTSGWRLARYVTFLDVVLIKKGEGNVGMHLPQDERLRLSSNLTLGKLFPGSKALYKKYGFVTDSLSSYAVICSQ
jgi:hypothetical protein